MDAVFWHYHYLGEPLSQPLSPPQAPPTRDAPAAASSSFTLITIPSSGAQFLVPRDKEGNATSHYKRAVPKLWRPCWDWGKKGNSELYELEQHVKAFGGTLKEAGEDPMTLFREFWSNFLGARVHGRIDIDDVLVYDALPWGENSTLHRMGIWFCLPLREAMPGFPQDFKESKWSTRDGKYIQTMHSSNFYSFKSSMHLGLQPGPATKSNLHGVYMFPTDSCSTARSSSGYRVYSCFFRDGYFWSVTFECAFGKFMSQWMGRMVAGNDQLAAKLGTFHVVKAWVHCLHYTEIEDCRRAHLTVNADIFDPDYEVTHAP